MNPEDDRFIRGCILGDGCLMRDKRYGSVTLKIQRKALDVEYATWQLAGLNRILGTSATLGSFNDKGKFPAVRFGVTSKEVLASYYEMFYPDGCKQISQDAIQGLGLRELAMFWMDDGSLEVRKRTKPSGAQKIERTGWLALNKCEESIALVSSWIEGLTGAQGRPLQHKRSGLHYLRWHSAQCRKLVEAIEPYVFPSLKYKVSLNRTGTVAQWLSESYPQTEGR